MFWPLIFMFRPAVCIAYFPYMPWGRDRDRYLTICLIHSLRNYWTIWTIGQAENSSWTTLLHGGDVGYNPPWTSAVIICTHLSRGELQSKRFATETMLIQTNLVLAPPSSVGKHTAQSWCSWYCFQDLGYAAGPDLWPHCVVVSVALIFRLNPILSSAQTKELREKDSSTREHNGISMSVSTVFQVCILRKGLQRFRGRLLWETVAVLAHKQHRIWLVLFREQVQKNLDL